MDEEIKHVSLTRKVIREKIEKYLGRKFAANEIVHHIDGNPNNNSFDNIFVFESQGEHVRYHKRVMRWSMLMNSMNAVQRVNHLKSFPHLVSNLNKVRRYYKMIVDKYCLENNEIIVNGIRILRPKEYQKLLCEVKKHYLKSVINTLLFAGMRYSELKRFHKHSEWFDGTKIDMPQIDFGGLNRTQNERLINLNAYGIKWVSDFLSFKGRIPSIQVTSNNITRWSTKAKVNKPFITIKTFRNTWLSWLINQYPNKIIEISTSLGFSDINGIKKLTDIPYDRNDESLIREYTKEWTIA